jgi:5-methylcytosine-specific restriction endonuclease McrA
MPDSTTRDLSTPRSQVFGDVPTGTTCRVCGRDVDDGRAKTCSDYCRSIQSAVMGFLNWSSVRRKIIQRDDETCQECGYDHARARRARLHIKDRIDERLDERPEVPVDEDALDDFDWDAYHDAAGEWNDRRDELRERYGFDELGRRLEVDHITPVSEGGHPFDPGNLRTLCDECHMEKTKREHAERASRSTPSRGDLSESLFEYVAEPGGEGDV